MAKEEKYINALQNFSKSVELLAESIKQHVNNNNDMNQSLSGSEKQTQVLLDYAKQLNVISEDTKETKSNTEAILKQIKSIRGERKNGIFDKIEKKDKKKSVTEGIKTMALMAGGILAIGAAFKIVGEVDFKSVIALSVALPAVSYAFNKVGESKMSTKDAFITAGNMVIMSAGIAGSAMILKHTPVLTLPQFLSAIGTSAALAISMWGLSNILKDVDIKKMYLTVPILPVIAGAIAASGHVLAYMPTITLPQVLSTIGIGLALGGAMIPLAFAARIAGKNTDDLVTMSVVLPILASGLYAASYLLQNMPVGLPIEDIIFNSLAIAGSVTALSLPLILLAKTKMGIKEVALGTLSMTIMSAGLMAMSHILAFGDYSKYPTTEWATGVGLSMLGYLPAVIATGLIVSSGIGALVLAAGIAGMAGIAGGLVGVSHILKNGTWTGGPDKDWAEGVGLSLSYFANAISKLSPGVVGLIMGNTLKKQIDGIEQVGHALVNVSGIIKGGSYKGGPGKDWAEGVGLSISYFANALDHIKPGFFESFFSGTTMEDKIEMIKKMVQMLPDIGTALGNDQSMYQGGPTKEWAEGVGQTVSAFANSIAVMADEVSLKKMDSWIDNIKKFAPVMAYYGTELEKGSYSKFPSTEWVNGVVGFVEGFTKIDGINSNKGAYKNIIRLSVSYNYLAKALDNVSKSLNSIKSENIPDMGAIYSGLTTLSLIDSRNLDRVMLTLNNRQNIITDLITNVNKKMGASMFSNPNLFNVNAKTDDKSDNKGNSGVQVQSAGVQVKQTSQQEQSPVIVQSENQEKLLSTIANMLQTMNSLLKEIAENTGDNVSFTSNITN